MKVYKTNKSKIPGTSFGEIRKNADRIFDKIKSKSKRTPYIRSKYFKKEKVFLNIFWRHLHEKNNRDKIRRLRYYACGLDLIQYSVCNPDTYDNFKHKDELLYKFCGICKNGETFIVQIKENKRTKRKDLISIYPK